MKSWIILENEINQLKRIWILNKLICYIALFFLALPLYGQEEDLYDHRLDDNKWEDLRDGIRYEGHEDGPGRRWTYESDEEYRKASKKHGGNGDGNGNGGGSGDGSGDGWNNGGGSKDLERDSYDSPPPSPELNINPQGLGVLGYVFIGIFILLLIFLIYYLFVNAEKDGTRIKVDYELENLDPTEIPLTELQRLLQECLDKGDYRGAIRIYFIFIIRGLADRKWIKWEKEKTNFHYLREMSGKEDFDDFNRSVSYFEIIWYGKRELDAGQFEKIRPNFTKFLDKLGIE